MKSKQTTSEEFDFALNKNKKINGNRRLVREKVLQILVAYFVSETSIIFLINHIFYRSFVTDENEHFNTNQSNNKNNSYASNDICVLSEEELLNIDSDIMIQWRDEDIEFGKTIIFSTIKNYNVFVDYIKEASEHWDFDRITIIDRTVIMIAIAEFIFATDVPIKVTINEAIELAKIFSTEKSPLFVNGMLEKIKSIIEKKNLINKSERGLK
jgi:N utilization substance protein B